jgi:hypothetical protein
MLRRHGAELVQLQDVGALDHSKRGQRDGRDDRALAPANRAVAAAWFDDAVGQIQFKDDRTAMAACAVLGIDGSVAYLLDHEASAQPDRTRRGIGSIRS